MNMIRIIAHGVRSALGLAGLSDRLDGIDNALAGLQAAIAAREPAAKPTTGPAFVGLHLRNGTGYALSVDVAGGDPYHRDIAAGAMQGEPTWRFLMDWLRPGETFFDLGANIGVFSIPAGVLGAQVHAFEMLNENVIHLERAARHNRIDSIAIVQGAVADQAGFVGVGGMSAWGHVLAGAMVSVPAIVIDDYVRLRGVTDVAVMKIDIEGSERPALAGAAATLARFHPDIVIESNTFQCGDHGYSYRDCLAVLWDLGYRIYRIHLDRLCPWTAAMTQEIAVADYFVTTKSAEEAARRSGWRIAPFTDADMADSIVDTDRQSDTHRRHVLAIAEQLPAAVASLPRVQVLLDRWSPLAQGADYDLLRIGTA